MLLIVYRVEILIRYPTAIRPKLPKDAIARLRGTFGFGTVTFILGFVIWNLDNVFCEPITRWKQAAGWPTAFLLEGIASVDLAA
jgi:dihydroceramidase